MNEHYIAVHYLNNYNDLYRDIYGVGSRMDSKTRGLTADAVISEFFATRTNSRLYLAA